MTEQALVIGEALIDVVRHTDGSGKSHPGGSPANVALGLGRLGRDVELLAYLAPDDAGETIREHLEASGVKLAAGSFDAPHTSIATARVNDAGVATYDFDLLWDVSAAAAPTAAPIVVHTGSIAAVIEPGGSKVLELVSSFADVATITYDPNARPALMGAPADARTAIEAVIARSDVVKVSDEDIEWLAPGEAVDDVARAWRDLGPALVVVTRGGVGATAFLTSGVEISVTAPKVTVADTVGAGDSFMGGLIDGMWSAGLLGARERDHLRHAHPDVIRAILERCVRIAAITVSRPGANPPGSAELGEA